MRALRHILTALSRLFWWPAIVGGVFVMGCAYFALVKSFPASPPGPRLFGSPEHVRDSFSRAFYLAASTRNAVTLVRAPGTDHMQLLLVDFETGRKLRLGSDKSSLYSPYLSPDGKRLMFTRQSIEPTEFQLVVCEIPDLVCRMLLKSPDVITSAVEIPGQRILYVSSPRREPPGRKSYVNNDIWLLDPAGGPRRLTDFGLYELHGLSVSDRAIYFSGTGPRRGNPVITSYTNLDTNSDIYRLPFDPVNASIELPKDPLAPLFVAPGLSTRVATSADETLVAFLRTRTDGAYRYNLVIEDRVQHTSRLFETSGVGYSQPVIIGRDVYAAVTNGDKVSIQVVRDAGPNTELLAVITDASLAGIATTELTIAPR